MLSLTVLGPDVDTLLFWCLVQARLSCSVVASETHGARSHKDLDAANIDVVFSTYSHLAQIVMNGSCFADGLERLAELPVRTWPH
jgi:hypothetical protein